MAKRPCDRRTRHALLGVAIKEVAVAAGIDPSAGEKVLVAAGSKHGSTTEIARRIGMVLGSRGLEVTIAAAEEAPDPASFDAIVLGSAVYGGRWREEAKRFADRIGATSRRPRVWLFSSGPLGDPPFPEEDPADALPLMEKTHAVEHHVFAGKMEKSDLSFGEKAMVAAVRAPDGDFRDWQEIESWAESIAAQILETDQAVDV